ncbi:MAG: AMMECR1 domain-containing protein, partial [Nitrospinales bacterium]
MPHPYVELAIKAVNHYLETNGILTSPEPLPNELKEKAGVFVSIKKHNKLRGCIGTITPTEPDLAQEIIS